MCLCAFTRVCVRVIYGRTESELESVGTGALFAFDHGHIFAQNERKMRLDIWNGQRTSYRMFMLYLFTFGEHHNAASCPNQRENL